MNEKYQNKYRIPSARLTNWDYASNAPYFVTICAKNRKHYFGDIAACQMHRSSIGQLVELFWHEIPIHFPFVILDAFIVMPNHIHGIIIIDKNGDNGGNGLNGDTRDTGDTVETPNLGVSTTNPERCNSSAQTDAATQKWKSGTLGVILNQFKRICTINARKTDPDFGWQSRFYDHIIRNDASFNRIRNYILTNPQNWKNDKFYG
ncbi:transposase [Marinilabilia rubra]|uniref:Transposase IS200-like domain-containing protein n=1 Tax=Marinilabilia rubra TaxID=2162893 RepID=A0A2U2B5H4_9BACT|nr:transposase [Marinilabilia rubra]PWD98317.1 hypothetical protein DDZ16_16190 [Marinilabilia rubra]